MNTQTTPMMALLGEAFDPSVDLDEFMTTYVPKFHQARLEEFRRAVDTPVIVSFMASDTQQRWTFELDGQGCEVESGTMVDFPVATIFGQASDWPILRDDLLEVAQAMEQHRQKLSQRYVRRPLGAAAFEEFEAIQGQIRIHITGTSKPIEVQIALGEYERVPGAKTFEFTLDKSLILGIVLGETDVRAAAKSLHITGSMSLAFELAGFASRHLGGSA